MINLINVFIVNCYSFYYLIRYFNISFCYFFCLKIYILYYKNDFFVLKMDRFLVLII